MLFDSIKGIDDLKDQFCDFFYEDNSDSFLDTLFSFINKPRSNVSVVDIKRFINANKESLSKIEDGIKNLLIGFVNISVLNSFNDVSEFIGLANEFEIKLDNREDFIDAMLHKLREQILITGKNQ